MTSRRVAWAAALGAVAILTGACSSDSDGAASTSSSAVVGTSSTAASSTSAPSAAEDLLEVVCTGAPTITDSGTITSPELNEISGLAAGRRNPEQWWVHNDSGDSARIFALSGTGDLLATVELNDANAQDWEDIAVGPGEASADGTIYVGDIGDNAGTRESVQVYRLIEPEVDPDGGDETLSADVDTLTLTYPDGPHDAEAMLIDPVDGDLIIITKDWSMTGASVVYRAAADVAAGSTTELEKVASLALPALTLVTGADVSADGSVVAVRSYGAVDLYPRTAGQPLWSAFDQTPCAGPLPTERQGEAIGFASDGSSYTTVSEGEDQVLHRTAAR